MDLKPIIWLTEFSSFENPQRNSGSVGCQLINAITNFDNRRAEVARHASHYAL